MVPEVETGGEYLQGSVHTFHSYLRKLTGKENPKVSSALILGVKFCFYSLIVNNSLLDSRMTFKFLYNHGPTTDGLITGVCL